jgi:hypothetical protein
MQARTREHCRLTREALDMSSGATFFSYLFFRSYEEKVHADKRRNQYYGNNKILRIIKAAFQAGYIYWILAYASMTIMC